MTTIINIRPTSFIDTEYATIPYSEATLHLNQQLTLKRDNTPFSQMGNGRFRKLFDRHTVAYRR